MSGLDLSRLSPADAAAALRSFDRRFRAAARPIDDPAVDAWAHVPGPDGHSALDHVAAAGRTLTLMHHALRQVRTHDEPYLEEAVMDADARTWAMAPGDLEVELAALGDVSAAMADLVDATPASDWIRTGRAPGPIAVDAMDIVREAVRSGVSHLGAAELAMTEARRA